jgi:hypothetical protein
VTQFLQKHGEAKRATPDPNVASTQLHTPQLLHALLATLACCSASVSHGMFLRLSPCG